MLLAWSGPKDGELKAAERWYLQQLPRLLNLKIINSIIATLVMSGTAQMVETVQVRYLTGKTGLCTR